MTRTVRTLAISVGASSLVLAGAASSQRPTPAIDAPNVIWKDAAGQHLRNASASAGSRVVRDAETGRLRPARAGELPETVIVTPTRIIDGADGSGIAVIGDDLMTESIAIKQPDGSVRIRWDRDGGMRPHPEVK